MFASLDALNFKKQGRKDDLISLCYMNCFLFNNGCIPFLEDDKLISKYLNQGFNHKQSQYHSILHAKRLMSLDDVAQIDNEPYKQFVQQVFSLRYLDRPDY